MSRTAVPRHDDYPSLDGLRLLAAVAVVVTHVAFQTGAYDRTLLGSALSRLDVGVSVFFVLSGFLLSRPWLLAAEHATPAPRTGRYLWHRAVRIAPTYLVTVVVALLVLEENAGASLRTWSSNLGLVALYTEDRLPDGLTQMWSLATEVAFYVLLPVLLLAALGRSRPGRRLPHRRLLAALAALTVANLVWSGGLATSLDGSPSLLQWLPGYLVWFGAGILVALVTVLVRRPVVPRWARTVADVGTAPWTCWSLALATFVLAATPLAGPVDFTQIPSDGAVVTKTLLYAVVGTLVVLPGVFAPAGSGFARVTSLPLVRHLGRTSYALFCCHLVVLDLVQQWLGVPVFGGRTAVVLLLVLVAGLGVAELLYRCVEVPATRLRNLRPPGGTRGASSTSSPAQTRETTTAS